MRIHHLNCASLRPLGGSRLAVDRMVCHCLLIETVNGLVLVDSGLGTRDLHAARKRLGSMFVVFARPRLEETETALRQVEALGFRSEDVRHVVLTHCDLDHTGGLPDFPRAEVHVLEDEFLAAQNPSSSSERSRYRAIHWSHQPVWRRYEPAGESWFGFPCVRRLVGLPDDILLIPLVGHTRGHVGVAVRSGQRWLLHCGDAYFHRERWDKPQCPIGLRAFQRLVAISNRQMLENTERLRELERDHSSEIRLFSAHDARELEACQNEALT